jgi:hypothetical protein
VNPKKIQSVIDRMRMFFVASRLKAVSRETVEKWARELEAALEDQK